MDSRASVRPDGSDERQAHVVLIEERPARFGEIGTDLSVLVPGAHRENLLRRFRELTLLKHMR
jgi:hypothetical protein